MWSPAGTDFLLATTQKSLTHRRALPGRAGSIQRLVGAQAADIWLILRKLGSNKVLSLLLLRNSPSGRSAASAEDAPELLRRNRRPFMKLAAIASTRPLRRMAALKVGLALVVPVALAGAVATATAASAASAANSAAPPSPSCPWLNQSLSVGQRVHMRKTVASVTLPTVSSGVGNGVTAMHIFAMAIGSGTATSGG
jgi:hypothetical protein